MLENLTAISFAKYGKIVRKGFDHAISLAGYSFFKQREVTSKKFNCLFVNEYDKTVLDIFDGTAILLVGTDKDNLEAFLLDKTIIMNPGVYFCVMPLLLSAKISCATTSRQKTVPVEPQHRPEAVTAQIEPTHIYTLFYHEKERGFRSKRESHYIWEITFVDKGDMYNVAGDTTYHMKQGDIMVFVPNQPHEQYADEDVSTCYVTLSFEMDFADTDIFDGQLFHADKVSRELIAKIIEESRENKLYSNDLMLCYLKELIIRLIRCKKIENYVRHADTIAKNAVENDIIAITKNYIEKNLFSPINVSQIAKSIPVSDSYLSSLFKRNTGMALVSYINKQKLIKAKDLIRAGQMSFTQIAQSLGYGSVHYFSTKFKKEFGITPTEYSHSIE